MAAQLKTGIGIAVGMALAFAAGMAPAQEAAPDGETQNNILNGVVKLEVVTSKAVIYAPWQNQSDGGDGSGVVIGDGRILTCAHCVADSTFIRIRKHNEDSIYKGRVEFIDNDCDLALVKVDDKAFMADVTPLPIGETPDEQAHVLAVGYPLGGEGLSFTEGIVSRIEDQQYAQSLCWLLAAQIDAAINPGNSGGPVLDAATGEICGIAFQGDNRGESLGYMIPTEIIRHFLRDIGDGVVNGFCNTVFDTENLESESARKFYKMENGMTGIRVSHVDDVLGTNSVLVGDIILEIDGCKVANNGNVRIEKNKRRSWFFLMSMRQIGENIPVVVLRDGRKVAATIPILKKNPRMYGFMYDKAPDYYVFGGFVFSTLSYDFLRASRQKYDEDVFAERKTPDDMAVVIADVLADNSVEGYLGVDGMLVRSVNGVKVRNLRHLVDLLDNSKDEFIRIGADKGDKWDYSIVVETAKMREALPNILETYNIPADRSKDLK